jgi:hypothetical protein
VVAKLAVIIQLAAVFGKQEGLGGGGGGGGGGRRGEVHEMAKAEVGVCEDDLLLIRRVGMCRRSKMGGGGRWRIRWRQ